MSYTGGWTRQQEDAYQQRRARLEAETPAIGAVVDEAKAEGLTVGPILRYRDVAAPRITVDAIGEGYTVQCVYKFGSWVEAVNFLAANEPAQIGK